MEGKGNDIINKSIDEITSMANEGDLDAINELAYRYGHGEGIEKNKEKAFQLYKSATEKGSVKAKVNLAMCYYRGNGIEKNVPLAFEILKELVEQHNQYNYISFFYLGEIYYWGELGKKDYEKAFFYYNEALKMNPDYLKAKFSIAYVYYSGKGTEKNYEMAFEMFSELVEKYKYKDAYFYMGCLYYQGKTGKKDYEKAKLYFDKSIEYNKNVYNSKYFLGEMYMFGNGVEADGLKAKTYFEEILDENYDNTYYKLALIYTGEYGLDKNEEKSKEYFNKIELDLCISLIYYVLTLKKEEEQNLEEILKILDSEMKIVEDSLFRFPENHPFKVYYNRLIHLKKSEYKDIMEKLKSKIVVFNEDEKYKGIVKFISSHEDVIELANGIINYPNIDFTN